ncbi:hypothetical protein [Burkholderia cepacia]|uniref:hypothetical protein n=1 Tax=Burkholderia cepacia TaxID=292 RepID=UPI002AB629A1|nr:hypothetical protein [Burkholderia cepacia]
MSMDERWVNRSPEVMVETFHWFRGEAFHLIVEDLLSFPPDQDVIVEGFRLLPALVEPLLGARSHAVWLIPTAGFRLNAFTSRGSLMDIAGRTSDPERALANLLTRDELFTSALEREANVRALPVIRVDEHVTTEESMARVLDSFKFDPDACK